MGGTLKWGLDSADMIVLRLERETQVPIGLKHRWIPAPMGPKRGSIPIVKGPLTEPEGPETFVFSTRRKRPSTLLGISLT